MQLQYLLVVIDVSDVKVMSSTIAVMFAITWVVNNYNIQTETCFSELNQNRTEIKKSILHIPNHCANRGSNSYTHWLATR